MLWGSGWWLLVMSPYDSRAFIMTETKRRINPEPTFVGAVGLDPKLLLVSKALYPWWAPLIAGRNAGLNKMECLNIRWRTVITIGIIASASRIKVSSKRAGGI